MTTTLSDRQKHDMHKAILDYLYHGGFTKTYNEFKAEEPTLSDFVPDSSSAASGILAKKWTSLVRLQRKVVDLESKLKQAQEELANAGPGVEGSKRSNKDWLPSSEARHVLQGHRDKINAVSFHPQYSVLASASVDATVKIWDWDSGECERTLKSHTKAVSDCQYDSTGKVLATCSDDLFIKLWNVPDDYKNYATLRGHEHSISNINFMPGDNQLISASRDNSVRVWDVQTSHCVKVLKPHDEWIRCALPSIDGRLLLTCSDDHTARITDMETAALKIEMRGHDNRIECVSFIPVAAIPAIRELVAMPPTAATSKIDALGISFVVTGSRDKTIKVWDALRGQCLWTFVGHDGWVQAITFHPSGKYLLSAADDHTMRVWDLKTGRCLKKIEAHSPFVQCIAWGRTPLTPEGTQDPDKIINVVATGGTDKFVKIWRP
ncbi:dynein regulator [Panaeolus papilionaceus]|nr:dynein regulator [Panaeolus papilionaceus]